MAQLVAVFVVALLGSCGASPVLHQPADLPLQEGNGVFTSAAADWRSWTSSGADGLSSSSSSQDSSSSEHLLDGELTHHPELNSVDGTSRGMGNDISSSLVSESSSEESISDKSSSDESSIGESSSGESSSDESSSLYEDDSEYESPPSLVYQKYDREITHGPHPSLLDSDHIVKYGDISIVSSRNENDTSTVKNGVERTDDILPAGNVSEIGPEIGSKQFEEELGAALKDTLHKMKMVLAGQGSGRRREDEQADWRQGLSRLRVKRSDEEESSEEVSALDELPVNSLNDIVDLFVVIARQALEERGLDQVTIPPLERNFSRSLGIGTLRGFFRGDGGWVRRLTTVRRLGNVWLNRGPRPPSGDPRDGRSVSVATSLGLAELEVGFERYVADVRALPTVSGRLLAEIEENAVLLNISFSKKDDDPKGCDVNILHLRVLQLSGINMKLTGLGPLNWLLSRIATWLTTHSQEKVAAVVEKELIGIANKEIGRMPCDADFITALYML